MEEKTQRFRLGILSNTAVAAAYALVRLVLTLIIIIIISSNNNNYKLIHGFYVLIHDFRVWKHGRLNNVIYLLLCNVL